MLPKHYTDVLPLSNIQWMHLFRRLNSYHALVIFPWNYGWNTIYGLIRFSKIIRSNKQVLHKWYYFERTWLRNKTRICQGLAAPAKNGLSEWGLFASTAQHWMGTTSNATKTERGGTVLKLKGCQFGRSWRPSWLGERGGGIAWTASSWPKSATFWQHAKWTKRLNPIKKWRFLRFGDLVFLL